MASLEHLNIAQQATTLLANARRDLLASAADLKGYLDRNEWTIAYVAAKANQQGAALVTLLDRIAANQAKVEEALTEWGVIVTETRADYTQVRNATIAMRDATAANVAATLSGIIAQVPSKARLF